MNSNTIEGMAEIRLTRTAAVMAAIRGRMAARTLAPGDRLPSIRRFAALMGVSPATVVEAYDRLVAEGLSNREIGARIHLGEATVKTHLLHAFAKLEVNDRTRAVTRAMELGLL